MMLSDNQEVSTTDSSPVDQESSRQPPAEQLAWELPSTPAFNDSDQEHHGEDQPPKEMPESQVAEQSSRAG